MVLCAFSAAQTTNNEHSFVSEIHFGETQRKPFCSGGSVSCCNHENMNGGEAMETNEVLLSDSVLWNDPLLWEELELQAAEGTIDLFPLPPYSYIYFSKLSLLFKAKHEGAITEAETEEAKVSLLREFQQLIETELEQEEDIRLLIEKLEQKIAKANEANERAKAVYVEYQNAIRTAGTLTSDIEKSHSVYEIMDIACKIIGLLTGDTSFHGRQLKKFSLECNEQDGSGE